MSKYMRHDPGNSKKVGAAPNYVPAGRQKMEARSSQLLCSMGKEVASISAELSWRRAPLILILLADECVDLERGGAVHEADGARRIMPLCSTIIHTSRLELDVACSFRSTRDRPASKYECQKGLIGYGGWWSSWVPVEPHGDALCKSAVQNVPDHAHVSFHFVLMVFSHPFIQLICALRGVHICARSDPIEV